MKKNILLIASTFVFASAGAQVWDGTSAAWTEGTGSQQDPYIISTPQHLAYLNEQVDAGETYEGKYFKLANDLDMGYSEGQKFDPIGFFDEYQDPENQGQMIDNSKYFLGVFDGNYKTIDNINVYFIDNVNEVGGTGLFACISKNAEIKNLTLGENSTIEGTWGTGTIVGAMTGGKVYNCVNKSSFNITEAMGQGGIVGLVYGGTVSCCVNESDLIGYSNFGGIAGFVDRGAKIENCYNTGDLEYGGLMVGGIIGYLVNGTVSNCYDTGKVSSDGLYAYAVVGSTDFGVTIDNCYYLENEGVTDENTGVTAKTDAEMKSADFLAALDNGQGVWVADGQGVNNGYPILKWQADVASSIGSVTAVQAGRIIVNGHYVSTTDGGKCRIVVTGLDGRIVADATVDGGEVYVAGSGIYVATIYKDGTKYSAKVVIR
jgi:hypothetical protein